MTVAPETIARAIRQNNYFRRSGARIGFQGGHKEWLHFALHAQGVDVLANFSLVDDVRHGAPPLHAQGVDVLANFSLVDDVRHGAPRGAEIPRIVTLVREEQWDGDIDQYDSREVEVRGGHMNVRIGDNFVRFDRGVLELKAKMRRRPIDMELVLRPEVMPNQANTLYVDGCPGVHWLSVPRWRASGRVLVGDRVHVFQNALAYHDHNWGNWRWGQNFAWEWGYAVPDDGTSAWTLIYVRLTDRKHLTDLTQSVFLWRGQRQHRFFRPDELTVQSDGFLRPPRIFKLPRVMGLVSRGRVTDIPKRLHVKARGDHDWLDFTFVSEDVAEVIIPNDDDLGVTIINEVSGSIDVKGEVDGESVSIVGHTIFEFLSD